MLRQTCDRHYGLGPTRFFEGEGGAPGGGEGGAAGAGGGAPPAAPPAGPAPEQTVPYSRFEDVNRQLKALQDAERQRADEEAKKKGDFEQLSAREKAAREAAEAKAARFARRAGFVAAATDKVVDVQAAYTLAAAQGMLDDLEVDDEGNITDPGKIDKIVSELLKRHEFLKPATKPRPSFGEPRQGTQPAEGDRPKDALGMIAAGYGDAPVGRRG